MTGIQTSPVSSETNADAMSDSGLSQRVPKCARCRCHGINCELKGHKEKCQFKDCRCRSCLLVVERQKITATRVAHLRHQRKIDKQRNNGYYSNYAPLTDEEEFVLSRYVDQPDERAKRRPYSFDYEYENGRPYKIPPVRYPGYPDHAPHAQYGGYYYPRSWEVHSRNKVSPCTRECCMPWKDRGYSEQLLAKRFYNEIPRPQVSEGVPNDRIVGDHPTNGKRLHVSKLEEQKFDKSYYGEPYAREGRASDESIRERLQNDQKRIKSVEKEYEKEVEIEVDVEEIDTENHTMKYDRNTDISGMKVGDRRTVDALRETYPKKHSEQVHGDKETNFITNADDIRIKEENPKKASVDQEREIAEQKRRRDEFIRSKCGEVLSVMFPDFDGKLVKNVAEKSGYDIQTAVEYLLDMKKRLREDETKSAFSAYKVRGSSDDGKPCKCCPERPLRYTPYMVTGHHEVRQRWDSRIEKEAKEVPSQHL